MKIAQKFARIITCCDYGKLLDSCSLSVLLINNVSKISREQHK